MHTKFPFANNARLILVSYFNTLSNVNQQTGNLDVPSGNRARASRQLSAWPKLCAAKGLNGHLSRDCWPAVWQDPNRFFYTTGLRNEKSETVREKRNYRQK